MINKLFSGDSADISVHFSGGTDGGFASGLPRFAPGDTVSGYVAINAAESVSYKKLIVRLKWRTEGRGDTDESVWTTIEEGEGTLTPGVVKNVPFSAVLPREPWSYSGRWITIVWGVEVEADVAWKVNPRHFAPFLLAPTWSTPER